MTIMTIIFVITALATSFGFGFAFKTILTKQSDDQLKMKKVTGIGGIFFKCKDPTKMKEWYKTHLGLNTNQYGTVFEWYQGEDSTKKDLHNGVRLMKKQNILSLLQRIL
jgi:hypothetical protein